MRASSRYGGSHGNQTDSVRAVLHPVEFSAYGTSPKKCQRDVRTRSANLI